MAVGDDVIYGFHGEFWKNSEANQFLHFRHGLFIGQFGAPNRPLQMYSGHSNPTDRLRRWKLPGAAGNSFAPSLVAGDDRKTLFLHHNDESGHGGVHRWRVTGIDTVVQLRAALRAE